MPSNTIIGYKCTGTFLFAETQSRRGLVRGKPRRLELTAIGRDERRQSTGLRVHLSEG